MRQHYLCDRCGSFHGHKVHRHPRRGKLYCCRRKKCVAEMESLVRRALQASVAGKARAKSFTPEYQRTARRAVSSASCAKSGRKGAAATRARHGDDFLLLKMRDHRLAHPSKPERKFLRLLRSWGVAGGVEREYVPTEIDGFLMLDFAWPDKKVAVEIHGDVHRITALDPTGDWAAYQERKVATLCQAGWRVLEIPCHSIDTSCKAVLELVRA